MEKMPGTSLTTNVDDVVKLYTTAVDTNEVFIVNTDIALLILNKCIEKNGDRLEFNFEFVEEFTAGSSEETDTEQRETE